MDPPRLRAVSLAAQAVAIVKTNSELKELWEEGDANKWREMVEDLERRLTVVNGAK